MSDRSHHFDHFASLGRRDERVGCSGLAPDMRARFEDTRTRVRFEDGEDTKYSTKNISDFAFRRDFYTLLMYLMCMEHLQR